MTQITALGTATLGTRSSDEARTRGEAKFKKKELQLQEGAKAMADYLAAGDAEREKTARLKAVREAKEAAEAAQRGSGHIEVKRKTARVRKTRAE